jgi:hypothetical protein
MPTNGQQQQVFTRRLERILLTFFLLATLFLVVVYVAAPSVYTNTLLLHPSPTDRYPLPATLLLSGIVVWIVVVMVGVLRHWR